MSTVATANSEPLMQNDQAAANCKKGKRLVLTMAGGSYAVIRM
jgi:hypothetical protein